MPNDFSRLVQETVHALSPHYAPAMQQARADVGFKSHEWGLLLYGCGAGPHELTAQWLEQMWGYVPAERVREELEGTAQRGFLAPAGDGAYRVTEAGRQALDHMYAAVQTQLATLTPLPDAQMERAAELLRHVVDAALSAEELANKSHIECSRRSDPGDQAAPLVRIDQYLTDLAGFRDGAHLASWQPSGLNGPAWEVLTLIWRGEACSLAAIVKQLERRSTTAEPYQAALADLVERELILEEAGQYHVTDSGRMLRQEAEDTTDRLSALPWAVLRSAEADELRTLLTRLRDSLQVPNEQVAG